MRRLLVLCLLLACSRQISGPAPAVLGARAQQDNSTAPATLCNAQGSVQADGWLVDVLGKNFAPLPTNALSGTPGVVMPQVTLIGPQPYQVPESRVRFADAQRLVLEVPTADSVSDALRLPPGDYDVSVANLGGASGSSASAIRVVDPPQLALLQVAPSSGVTGSPRLCRDSNQSLIVTGSGFRPDAPPRVSLVNGPAGAVVPLTVSAASDTQLTVPVPIGTFSGPQSSATGASYTVRVQDPAGCFAPSAATPRMFNVTDVKVYDKCKSLGPLTVTPAFGWSQRNQPVTIHVTGAAAGLFTGGAPNATITARLKGGLAPVTIPLRSVGFLDINTITAVVPTCSGLSSAPAADPATAGCPGGMLPDGAYSIDIEDPKGAFGALQFAVLGPELPTIASISPASVDTSGTTDLTIASGGLSGATFPALAKPQIVFAVGAGVVRACDLPLLSRSAVAIHAQVQPVAPGLCADTDALGVQQKGVGGFTPAAGLYVVRVQDTAGPPSAYGDYTGLIITNPGSGPANGVFLSASLNTARASFSMVQAADDTGARFLYALGGIDGPIGKTGTNGSNALSSVEIGALDAFGDVASFQPGGPLSSARRGASAVSMQVPGGTGYVFVLGGVDSTGKPAATVERAQVLRRADAPVLDARPDTGGFLFAGTFYYRVSAVLSASDANNPGGETLASDLQPVTVANNGRAVLTWTCVPNAVTYRIYRTAGANQPATNFRQVAQPTAVANCTGSPLPKESYTDGGAFTMGQAPQAPGALGTWMPMPSLGSARGEAAARLVGDRIYVVGGCGGLNCDGALGGELASYESAQLSGTSLGAFSTGSIAAARRRTALALANKTTAPDRFTDASTAWLVLAGGEAGTALTTTTRFEVAQVVSGGLALAAPTFSTAAYTLPAAQTALSGGWAEVAGDLLLAYGNTGTAATFALDTRDVCGGATCGAAASFSGQLAAAGVTVTNRYLPGETFWTGFAYVGGGLTNSTSGQASTATALSTVERILY